MFSRFLILAAILFIIPAVFLAVFWAEHNLNLNPPSDQVSSQLLTLYINEFVADNETTLEDPDEAGEFPDWVELYNPGPAALDLGGLYLTDDLSNATKFRITDTITIPAGGFTIFYADGDPEQGPFHTNFKLGKGGEEIGVFSGTQQIDAYIFGPQTADVSEGRCPDGGDAWIFFTAPTPGVTNEPCGTLPSISNTSHTPMLPALTDIVTVTATITDSGTVVSTTLWYSGGVSFVSTPMASLDGDVYAAAIPPHPDGTWVAYHVWAENDAGFSVTDPLGAPTNTYRYLVGYQPPGVCINEFMAKQTTLEDPDEPGENPDWIEIYNPGPGPVDLGGLYLTDNLNEPTQFRVTDTITIPAGGFTIFFADDDPEQGPFHTNFKLDKEGEEIGLFGAEGTVQIDAVVFITQTTDVAFGRLPDGTAEWLFLTCPTPGSPNGCRSYLPRVVKGF